MTNLTIGATGDYARIADCLAAIATPLTDDYSIRMQAGLYLGANNYLLWNNDNNGHTVRFYAVNGDVVTVDVQTTSANACLISDGGLTVEGIRFTGGTTLQVSITNPGTEKSTFLRCAFEGGTRGVDTSNDALDVDVIGCDFVDFTDRGYRGYTINAAHKLVRGCTFRTTLAINPVFGIEAIFSAADGLHGLIDGCRFSGHANGINGCGTAIRGKFLARNCRAIDMRTDSFSFGSNSVTTVWHLENCVGLRVVGTTLDGIGISGSLVNAQAFRLKRCLFKGHTRYGVSIASGSTPSVTLKHVGIVGGTYALNLAVIGNTVTGSYDGYYGQTGTPPGRVTGAGAAGYTSPETGEVTSDPLLDATSQDGIALTPSSPWKNTGNADGLPTCSPNPDIGAVDYLPAELQEA